MEEREQSKSQEGAGQTDAPLIEEIGVGCLLISGEAGNTFDQLLGALWRRRQATLLALELMLARACPNKLTYSEFAAAMRAYKRLESSLRRALMEHPPFRAWLKQTTVLVMKSFNSGTIQCEAVEQRLVQFSRLLGSIAYRRGDSRPLTIERYSVDPLIAEVAPPSYVFNDLERKQALETVRPYTLAFFAEVVETALQRIEHVWPGFSALFSKFVKTIIHLPDAAFRSCSAHRFAGVIMLSAQDDTLLSVEESLIHEWGHQVLYCLMELDPLIRDDGQRMFVLPWSGAERDIYGYFHAAYIYFVLSVFLARALGREPVEDIAVRTRLLTILTGLEKALTDLDATYAFTPAGRRFFDQLARRSRELINSDRSWLFSFPSLSSPEL